MAKEAVFTMKLEPELRDAFMAAAKRVDEPASHIMRRMMRKFLSDLEEAGSYEEYYRRKVEQGLREMEAGLGIPGEEVEDFFAEKRKDLRRRTRDAA